MFKTIILAVALVAASGTSFAADGSLQPDPIFKYSKDSSKKNFILRDKDGRRVGYLINDPIFPGKNWIRFDKGKGKVGNVLRDPIFPNDNYLIFDLDPVGE